MTLIYPLALAGYYISYVGPQHHAGPEDHAGPKASVGLGL